MSDLALLTVALALALVALFVHLAHGLSTKGLRALATQSPIFASFPTAFGTLDMVPLAATAHTSNDQHGAGHGGDLTAACSLPTSSPSADRLTIGTISGTLRNGYRRVICAREAPSMSGTLLREGATQHRAHTVEEDEEE